MQETKTPLILLIIGLLLIGWLFYFVNIKEDSSAVKQEEQLEKAISTPKTPSGKVNQTAETKNTEQADKNPENETNTNSDRYAPKSYHEVFKEEPAPKSDIERITEEQRAQKLREESDALIKKAEAIIEEKNLKANQTPPSPEELEKLQNKLDALKNN